MSRPMEIITGNVLGLRLSELGSLGNLSKGKVAENVLPPGMTFDYALPQDWLNHFKGTKYEEILSRGVWAYPENTPYRLFGVYVDLLNGNLIV